MWVFVDRASETVLGYSGLTLLADGSLGHPDLAHCLAARGLHADEVWAWPVTDLETAKVITSVPLEALLATIVDSQVVGVTLDPNYTPPAPAPDPVQARLAALESALERIPLNTPHNRRWLAQKERVKAAGIAYIQAHPACAQADLEQALAAELAADFPGDPIVVNAVGVIQSYVDAALAQGFIAEASFPALRDLVAASSATQIQTMLQTL